MNLRAAVWGSGLLIAAAASWLLTTTIGGPGTIAPTGPADPGYYLRDVRLLGVDRDGAALYELRAARVRQLPETEAVMLEDIELEYAAHADVPWRLWADTGRIPAGGDTLELVGKVRLESAIPTKDSNARLETERLDIAVYDRVASTSEEVTVDDGPHQLVAKGLHADLTAEALHLESSVRGRFVPPSR